MNISYKWINELIDSGWSEDEMAARLTAAGCAIEEMNDLPGGDKQLVAEITSNRPDWLCHFGVAREISALTGKPVKYPEVSLSENSENINDLVKVTVKNEKWCPRYTARLIKGVTVKESPAWLKSKLEAVGLRPINNIVDITNYIIYEMNQPLHAFDFDLLKGGEIIVRLGVKGEKITSIDETVCELTPEMLVIADSERPVAIAGVMGGAETEVSEKTVNILLEAASFETTQVRRTSRKLNLLSDSSYRFERALDIGGIECASARACQLILELAGGELVGGIIDTAPEIAKPWNVTMRYSRCTRLLGVEFSKEKIKEVFAGLGLKEISENEDELVLEIPTYRRDLTRETDLIEEVVRIIGFDKVPEKITMKVERGRESAEVSAERIARQTLANLGYHECMTNPFVPEKWQDCTNAPRILNPIDSGRPVLKIRNSSLLEVRKVNRGESDVQLFEINPVYSNDPRHEKYMLTIIDDRGVEYCRGALEELLKSLRVVSDNVLNIKLCETEKSFAAGSGIDLYINDTCIGEAGIVSDAVAKMHDLTNRPAILEVDFDFIASLPRSDKIYKALPKFPGIRRDIALVVPEEVKWLAIEEVIIATGGIEDLHLESVYRGKGLEPGTKSVAFSFTYRDEERSLTDEEANERRDVLIKNLSEKINGAKLR